MVKLMNLQFAIEQSGEFSTLIINTGILRDIAALKKEVTVAFYNINSYAIHKCKSCD